MKIAKKAGSMSAAVFTSRIFGLIREQVFAFLFGSGLVTDSFIVAFRIPNLFRDLLAEGALSNAFVSVFAKSASAAERKDIFQKVTAFLIFVLVILLVVLYFFIPTIIDFLASSFRDVPQKYELTVGLTRFLLPFLFFTSLAAISAGVLNTLGLFFLPALGPLRLSR